MIGPRAGRIYDVGWNDRVLLSVDSIRCEYPFYPSLAQGRRGDFGPAKKPRPVILCIPGVGEDQAEGIDSTVRHFYCPQQLRIEVRL